MAIPNFFKQNEFGFWKKVFLVGLIFCVIQVLVLSWYPSGWEKHLVQLSPEAFQYWDAEIYAQLAIAPACTAFYPLWPRILAVVSPAMTQTVTLKTAIFLSQGLFLLSLPLALFVFEKIIRNRAIAFLVFFLYALGPNAIFQSIGYTETLFSILSLFLLWTIRSLEEQRNTSLNRLILSYGIILILSSLLSLTRPVLIQTFLAIAFALLVSFFLSQRSENYLFFTADRSRWLPRQSLGLAVVIGSGTVLGYCIYGAYCLRTTGDFFAPFQAQVEWGRSLGFRPWLLLFPRSLLFDLHGIYLPALLMVTVTWLLTAIIQKKATLEVSLPKQNWVYIFLIHPLVFSGILAGLNQFARRTVKTFKVPVDPDWVNYLGRFSVLYAIAFSSSHGLINFFVNSGFLYSASRHFFGTPFAFVGMGALLSALSLPKLNRVTWAVAIVGILLLINQWMSYGTEGWLG